MKGKKLRLYVLKFDQPPFGDASTHWALFLPDETVGKNKDGIPISGTLFHAHINCSGACAFKEAQYRQFSGFKLSVSPSLRSALGLDCPGVTTDHLDKACQKVSAKGTFNLVTRNCQEWVKEVLAELVIQELIPKSVFKQMQRGGFKTLKEHGKESSSSSVGSMWSGGMLRVGA